jgi:hypothetical protein
VQLSVRPFTNYNKTNTVGHVSYLSLNITDPFTSYRILDINVYLKQNRFDSHFLLKPPRPLSFLTNRQRPSLLFLFTVPSLTEIEMQSKLLVIALSGFIPT